MERYNRDSSLEKDAMEGATDPRSINQPNIHHPRSSHRTAPANPIGKSQSSILTMLTIRRQSLVCTSKEVGQTREK